MSLMRARHGLTIDTVLYGGGALVAAGLAYYFFAGGNKSATQGQAEKLQGQAAGKVSAALLAGWRMAKG